MADNKTFQTATLASLPSGTNVATDEVGVNGGSVADVQFVKLVDGRANGTDGLPGDTGGLWVEAHRDLQRIAVTSGGLTTATTAYTSGDQVGTIFTFANAAKVTGGTGTLVAMQMVSAADITGAYDCLLFRASVTLAADNATFAISDADALNFVGLVQLYTAYDIGNNRIAVAQNISIPYDCNGGTSLFGALINRAGHTFFGAATDLQLTAWVERN